ncbi:MAG TPA: SusF/SusE family outer membrane protein [Saprospiraceae bacterium]|nr:SusF/SusE family outer membrane protein [Saprospiraceae bacterium]
MMKLRLLFSLFLMIMVVSIKAQITTVGLIGSATPGGWDADTDMVQDPDSSNLWTMSVTLIAGEAKFRANDLWDVNWGDIAFPLGVGTQNGPNISVPAGDYYITFNSNTGAYYFSVISDIGIIGSATPFGWDNDVNMFQSESDTNVYTLSLTLLIGEAKFRQFDAWDINWGSTDFPTGVGTQNGPNIPIPTGGEYYVTFNKSTGEYNFQLISFSTVGVIGDATAGGWGTVTPLTQTAQNPKQFTGILDLGDGGLQFSGDNGVAVWGGSDFPSGVASAGGDTIPVTAGTWRVNFNTQTQAYSFEPIEIYGSIGIIGDATLGGWDNDTDLELQPNSDSSLWQLRLELFDGEAKFRADNDWLVNWGAGDFPTGIALRDGPNIPITAGEYSVTFNSFTGAYNFVLIVVPDRVGLVGSGTPTASWDVDFFLTQSATDENVWTYNSIDLNGEVKFRADGAWTVNWGAVDFPSGVGVQEGPNIPVPQGTYGITFNSNSGEYVFGDPITSTTHVLDPSSIKAFPNPANDVVNVDLSAIDMRGNVTLNVYDINGKLMLSDVQQGAPLMKLGVAGLSNGFYTVNISNGKYIIGKKFSIVR